MKGLGPLMSQSAAAATIAPAMRREFRLPLGPRLLSLFVVLVLAGVSVILIAVAVYIVLQNWALGLFCAVVACFVAALTGYVFRDLSGKWGLRVVLDADAATLDLPAGRSLIHRPPSQHLTVPYADIASVETRLEAYGSLGMEMMQRAYVLRRKSGEPIFLFEDRALATGMRSSFFADVAAELAARAGVALQDLGMVEGGGGLLGVWGTHAVDWGAPSLPLARQLRLWRHAASTGSLAIAIVILAILMRVMMRG